MRTVCRQRHSLFARLSVLAAGALVALAVMPQRAAAQWSEQVLYGFCSQPGCTDGVAPLAALLMDAAGNLYGTTSAGGTGSCAIGCGTAFRLAPDGTQTVLYSFSRSLAALMARLRLPA